MKYKCIQAFSLYNYDEEGHSFYVRKGSMWREPDINNEDDMDIKKFIEQQYGEIEFPLIKDNGDYLCLSNEYKKYFELLEEVE